MLCLMAGERCAGRNATVADSLGTLACFKSPRVTPVPGCHPCARHRHTGFRREGWGQEWQHEALRHPFPKDAPPAGRGTGSSLFPFGSWVSFRVYIYFWSVEASVTQRVFSEGKTNPNEIPEQSSRQSRAACFWKWCLQKGWKSWASNQKCNQPWPVSQGQTSHGPQGLLLSLLTLISPFSKSSKVARSSLSCIKLPKSDR